MQKYSTRHVSGSRDSVVSRDQNNLRENAKRIYFFPGAMELLYRVNDLDLQEEIEKFIEEVNNA